MNDQIKHSELDRSEPDPAPERRRDDPHELRLGLGACRWLAMVAALAVGAALGGAGVWKERDAATAREGRRTIARLTDQATARLVQLAIEYDPYPTLAASMGTRWTATSTSRSLAPSSNSK